MEQNQNNVLVKRLQKFQEKVVCLINFETNPNVVGQLVKDSNILKLPDFIKYKYALFIRNSLRKEKIPIFKEFYTLFNQNHVYNRRATRGAGGRPPLPCFENEKKSALFLEKKALIASNLMLNLLFKMSSREYVKEKTAKLFLEGAFFSGIFDEMFIGVP